jgi:hypothetical protein
MFVGDAAPSVVVVPASPSRLGSLAPLNTASSPIIKERTYLTLNGPPPQDIVYPKPTVEHTKPDARHAVVRMRSLAHEAGIASRIDSNWNAWNVARASDSVQLIELESIRPTRATTNADSVFNLNTVTKAGVPPVSPVKATRAAATDKSTSGFMLEGITDPSAILTLEKLRSAALSPINRGPTGMKSPIRGSGKVSAAFSGSASDRGKKCMTRPLNRELILAGLRIHLGCNLNCQLPVRSF